MTSKTKIPPTIIVCDCEGEYNGTAYFTGQRFHDDKGLARIYRDEESLVAGSLIAEKVMVQNHAGAWADYTLKNMRRASPSDKFTGKVSKAAPKKIQRRKPFLHRLKSWLRSS